VLLRLFKELQLELDNVRSIIDGNVVRADQDASGGKGGSVRVRVSLSSAACVRRHRQR